MSWKSTLILTSALFLTMLVAGSGSAYISYKIGEEALKGVTQPDANSEHSLKKDRVLGEHKGLKLISEKEILIKVYNLTQGQKKSDRTARPKNAEKSQQSFDGKKKLANNRAFIPIKDEAGGVSMEIVEAGQNGNYLLLHVTLINKGSKAVRFLYSFLDVRDDRGIALSAIADGLPGELPPNGEKFSGTLRIPTVLLDRSQKISLTLTDYPEQNLELKLKDIPTIDIDR
ncbi:MAG: hypothetical protein AB4368_31985 [Xenococcaceae cyanobacterium]